MQRSHLSSALIFGCLLALPAYGQADGERDATLAEVTAVLADFHDAAATADRERCFGHLAEDAILFGTDPAERWTRGQYAAFAAPAFAAGVVRPRTFRERSVYLSESGAVAWFDERQVRPGLVELRDSGVLLRRDGAWKIVQYHLSLPVPNELVPDLTRMVRASAPEGAAAREAPEHGASDEAERSEAARAVEAVLDDFHRAAAEADGERYFGYLAADGIFHGTAADERFDVQQLRALVEPYFSRGEGPVATPVRQDVCVAPDGETAWFDEVLENAGYCGTRATGVLCEREGRWEIVHFNLTFPVPNALVEDVVARIRELGER